MIELVLEISEWSPDVTQFYRYTPPLPSLNQQMEYVFVLPEEGEQLSKKSKRFIVTQYITRDESLFIIVDQSGTKSVREKVALLPIPRTRLEDNQFIEYQQLIQRLTRIMQAENPRAVVDLIVYVKVVIQN